MDVFGNPFEDEQVVTEFGGSIAYEAGLTGIELCLYVLLDNQCLSLLLTLTVEVVADTESDDSNETKHQLGEEGDGRRGIAVSLDEDDVQ